MRSLTKCKRCGWQWFRREPVPPRRCPNPECRSMLWDKKPQRTTKSRRARP
jgi:predicted Zn-ribbon and HTH transcriptional regulator